MKQFRGIPGALVVAMAAALAHAQAPVYPPPPQAFASIVHQPPQSSSFTLDRSMLGATDGFFNSNPEGRRIVAGLNSITFTNFHFHDFAAYDGAAFGALNAAYAAAGFHHLVNANQNSHARMLTDLWLRTQGAMVTNVVVLTRGDRNMNAISVDCNLRPLDLLHLSGHFGIPQVDANAVMVPAGPPGPAGAAPPPGYAQPQNYPQQGDPAQNAAPDVAATQPQPLQNPPTLRHHGADDPQ